ncbi:MAG: VPS10 domain-containing protein, partial [Blastocatellia bacterium]
GDGIYKSTDAGKTWQNMGLRDSHHITRIVTHPTNPDILYVAAMGHLFTTNEERGVFKTTDGGKTWKKVLYVNDRTGAIDLVLSRNDPNVLYAAAYDLKRDPWRIVDGGAGSGIYKTTDGGTSWKKLDNGLPIGTIGRIGLDLFQKNPNVVYAVVDNRNLRAGTQQIISGEVYRTDDAGASWRKVSADRDDVSRKSGYAFNILRVHPENPDRVFITGSNLIESTDGGKTWSGLNNFGGGPQQQSYRPFRRAFGDFRVMWIDPNNPERMMAGSDGGLYISYDGAKTCDHLNNLPLGEIYALTVDMAEPYNIYAGLQDHESWRGPSNGWSGSVGIEDWTTTGIGDGMYNQVDPTDNRWLYNTQEFGRPARFDQKTRERKVITPSRKPDQPMLRFNWVTPMRLSPHDAKTLYLGAQALFRSTDRGDTWQEISPDLTTNDANKISPPSAAIQHCTITTISESPKQAGVIWVGADDGKVQVTKDAGANWFDATGALAKVGGLQDAWTNRVFASHYQVGTAYVAKSRHRQDDFRPFLFKTTDFGATWTAIHNNLPQRPINVIWEDNVNPDLLFVGNDAGVYVSLDGGKVWTALKGNMPLVAVHDLIVHPREGDLVVGTYGRGIWVTDITPLREMQNALQGDAYLFAIEPKARRREGALGNYRLYGDRLAVTPNEPNGLSFVYYLKEGVTDKVTLTVTDASGKTIRTLDGATKAGLNRVVLPLVEFGQFGGGRGANAPPPIAPGEYTVTLQANGKQFTQTVRVLAANVP